MWDGEAWGRMLGMRGDESRSVQTWKGYKLQTVSYRCEACEGARSGRRDQCVRECACGRCRRLLYHERASEGVVHTRPRGLVRRFSQFLKPSWSTGSCACAHPRLMVEVVVVPGEFRISATSAAAWPSRARRSRSRGRGMCPASARGWAAARQPRSQWAEGGTPKTGLTEGGGPSIGMVC